jgi:hypothetical protein
LLPDDIGELRMVPLFRERLFGWWERKPVDEETLFSRAVVVEQIAELSGVGFAAERG